MGAKMADQDQDKALNLDAEIETAETTTPVEEQTTEEVQEETSKEPSKKGYSQRVQELANKAKTAEERAASLEEKLAELTSQVGQGEEQLPPYQQPSDEPLVKPNEEITVEELNRRQSEREKELLKRAAQMTEFRLQQERVLQRINKEANEVVTQFQQLNPNSDNYDPELSGWVTDTVADYIRSNPTGSVKKLVNNLMKPYQKAVDKEVAEVTETVAKQVSQTAIRPSGAQPADKKFDDLSIEEMEAKLGYAPSS